jgi:putative peptidoglycan lipid II flippase
MSGPKTRGRVPAPGAPAGPGPVGGNAETSGGPRTAEAVRNEPGAGRRQGFARAAGITAGLSVAGSVFGLVRDQGIAHLFGAGAESDAFLVAWTVPEVAATVLIEDAMALLMVPAFSGALARGGGVRGLVRGTLPRLLALLGLLTAALVAGAPWVVRALAPGLADPSAAVACTRLTALSVLTFGLAGYLSAALRAHRRFVPPAAIYVAYNAGIVATLYALHGRYGVQAAAAGVAVGGFLMVAVQLPSAVKELRASGPTVEAPRDPRRDPPLHPRLDPPLDSQRALGLALLAPVVLFTLSRQAQVLVERFFAAPLPAGAISHLNYAQKVAQLPMALSVMICTVTFPAVSRALAEGDRDRARRRVERDLTLACVVVLVGAAYVIACAPQIIEVLFQRGEFTASDTAATAAVMRVYALGLLGQSLVGALVRPYFSAARPTWYPAASMAAGLLVTAVADAATVGPWGAYGIAAGNAAGITVTAGLLLHGLGAHSVAVRARAIAPSLTRTLLSAAVATLSGWLLAARMPGALSAVVVCGLAVPAAFAAAAVAVRVPELPYPLATVNRKARR